MLALLACIVIVVGWTLISGAFTLLESLPRETRRGLIVAVAAIIIYSVINHLFGVLNDIRRELRALNNK